MKVEEVTAYELLEKRKIEDLDSFSYLLRHKKTGARIALLSNQDENKVFYIGFRTPPKDSTGVAHILEHSVLCGSKEFPIKDPFVELVKGSLNTFLNAMTYPDKTVYPVASCNDKDFQNLMHVYLDAVFYPNIYQNENIFRQEGWHYELEEETGELTVNGVVYNEMKGAFSSPDDVLEREIMNSLFPDNAYGKESGGDPEVIPQLTYSQFLEFHKRYYHPSNSYIYLYGDMDMAEKLIFMDKYYLSAFDALEVDSSIPMQPSFEKEKRIAKDYPISDTEEEKENTYLSVNVTAGDCLDKELYLAFEVIDYALCSAPGAPLKKALVEKGIGKDVYSEYSNGIQQPYFSIIAKNADTVQEEEFLNTTYAVLEDIVKNGFDRKALLAGINCFEFKYREADFGSRPKGLMYGLQILDSWLYDESKPFLHIEENETFAALRSKVEEGYFEKLVKEYLLENSHKTVVILQPKKGLALQKEKEWKEKLAEKKFSFSEEQIQKIIEAKKELTAFQEMEDKKEDLEKIPLLTREDMKKEAAALVNEERFLEDIKVLYHPLFTNGIGYIKLIFKLDQNQIPAAYFPYIGILKAVLMLLNTEHYTYGDLFNEINIVTGGMDINSNHYTNVDDIDKSIFTLEVKTKVLNENMEKAITLMEEVILSSDLSDTKRLREIIAEAHSHMQAAMISSGHVVALSRALSYGSVSAAITEEISGVSFYRMITDLEAHFEERKEELVQKLQELVKMIFRSENLMVDFTGTEEGYQKMQEPIAELKKKLYMDIVEKGVFAPEVSYKKEGFMTPGQVQYVCCVNNFRKKGLPYVGTLLALKVIMGYEYLWTNIRVKGGAYGCMCGFNRLGDCYFVSYRDPHLKETIEVYKKAAEAIASFQADERTMTQYIIGAISDLDIPLTPALKGSRSLSAYMTGITQEMIQKEREELLATQPEDIRKLSEYIKAFMEDYYLCVVGSEQKLQEQKELFLNLENL